METVGSGDLMPKRIDANQPEIVLALRKAGCSVLVLSELGKGAPDLLVGELVYKWRGLDHDRYERVNYLLELKDGTKPPSRRKLTADEQQFHDTWKGQVCIVSSVDEALAAVGIES